MYQTTLWFITDISNETKWKLQDLANDEYMDNSTEICPKCFMLIGDC